MKIYFAAHGNKNIIKEQIKNNWGMMNTPFNWRTPTEDLFWALDNGAYSVWKNNLPFPSELFLKTLNKIPSNKPPNFIVCPDIVAAGKKSLNFSLSWIEKCPKDYEYYLSVQDGMKEKDILPIIKEFDGVFVGGTMKWKIRTAERWCCLAHKNKIPCHIARIGIFKRLLFARTIGANSIDSSTFVQGPDRLGRIENIRGQQELMRKGRVKRKNEDV